MSEYTNSIILVGTQSARGTFNVLWREIGFDVAGSEGTLIVACSASGNTPASHYAAHIWERDAFVQMLQDGQAGTPNPLFAAASINTNQIRALLANVTISVQTKAEAGPWPNPLNHLNTVLASMGLQRITNDAP